MEANPCEAVKNNVSGTQTIAEAARRHRVARFVLISTDKAANPSSVMGATKRVAELIVQMISADAETGLKSAQSGFDSRHQHQSMRSRLPGLGGKL